MERSYSIDIPGVETSDPIEVRSPYSGEVVGTVQTVSSAGMHRALELAGEAFDDRDTWLPVYRRAEILEAVSRKIAERKEELALLAASEGGKPLTDSLAEVTRAANTVKLCAEQAASAHGREWPMDGSAAGVGHVAFTVREPIGVVAAVSAFNHPLNLIAHQVGTAIAAGCPVLIKPDHRTPLSCMEFIRMLRDVGLPTEWAMAVPCRREVAQELVTSDRIAFFSFVGSAEVGWMLRSKLAPGVRCALEHGGIAPIIIDESADLATAIPATVKAGFYHAGQVCVSAQRIFVHEAILDRVTAELTHAAKALKVGDPAMPETEIGPIIDNTARERIHGAVMEAVEGGAKLLTGGEMLQHGCYAATVLLNAPPDSSVMTEEVFGPVITISGFRELDDAVARCNSPKWSFQSAIFTGDVRRALHAAKRLDAATVTINEHPAFRVDWMPFGGRKQSGMGVGGVAPAVHDQTQEKLVVLKGW